MREAIRNKLLYTLLFFAIVMIGAGVVLSALSYVEGERILQDFGFAAIRLFSVAIAIFVGVSLIHREVERRTIYTILSKPVSRTEFLLGKYVGLVLTIWMQMAIMVAAFAVVSLAHGRAARRRARGWRSPSPRSSSRWSSRSRPSSRLHDADAGFVLHGRDLGGRPPHPRSARHRRQLGLRVDQRATALFHRVLPDLESFNFSIEAAHGLASRPVRRLAAARLRRRLRRDPADRADRASSSAAISAECAAPRPRLGCAP